MARSDRLGLKLPGAGGRLSSLAAALEARHAPGRAGPGQPRAIVESAARKWAADGLAGLDARENKAVPELLWDENRPLGDSALLADWLAWAETEWRPEIAETRICIAMLRHFDPRNPATAQVSSWLGRRQERLWGRFGDFVRHWRLTEAAAPQFVADRLAAGDMKFVDDIKRNQHARRVLTGSGLIVAIMEAFARRAAGRVDDDKAWDGAETLVDLLGSGGLRQAGGPEWQRASARGAMVDGLVACARRRESPETIGRAIDLSFRLAGDPRLDLCFWRDISESALATVEKWLAARTVEASFQIVAELKSDEPATLQSRIDFWSGYFPHMIRARLVGARKAKAVAARIGEPCCDLQTYLSDHCGFLVELRGEAGSLVVLELNNRAQALFWPQGEKAPGFDQGVHDGGALRGKCSTLLSHLPPDSWPRTFSELIAETTGLAPQSKATGGKVRSGANVLD